MATVKDVARLAGVSLGTVSNVINGKASVKPESREKVYRAMKELNFRYNLTAGSLRTGTTKNVGLVIPTIVNPYYPELARGVEDELRKAGITLFLCNSDRDGQKERQYVNALLSRGADGLILVKTGLSEEELKDLNKRTNMVLVDYQETEGHEFRIVNVNDRDGVMKGMNLLGRYGHSRIAFISGTMDAYSSSSRISAYMGYLKANHIPLTPEYLVEGDYSWESGYRAACRLFSLDPLPTAIFAANDIMAIGVIKAAEKARILIPHKLSVMGYDDIEMSNLCTPALTTIHQPKYEVGTEAARILINSLQKKEEQEKKVTLEIHVVERESVTNSLK